MRITWPRTAQNGPECPRAVQDSPGRCRAARDGLRRPGPSGEWPSALHARALGGLALWGGPAPWFTCSVVTGAAVLLTRPGCSVRLGLVTLCVRHSETVAGEQYFSQKEKNFDFFFRSRLPIRGTTLVPFFSKGVENQFPECGTGLRGHRRLPRRSACVRNGRRTRLEKRPPRLSLVVRLRAGHRGNALFLTASSAPQTHSLSWRLARWEIKFRFAFPESASQT